MSNIGQNSGGNSSAAKSERAKDQDRFDDGRFAPKGTGKTSGSSKTFDNSQKSGYTKLVLDDDDSRAVYERITAGKLYELDELYELPVFKKIEAKIGEYEQKYGITSRINTPEREQLRKNWVQQFLVGDGADTMPPNGKPLKKSTRRR